MRSNGFLTGVAMTTEGGERRLLGSIDEMPIRLEADISAGDWICGILLHIPAVEFVGRPVGDVDDAGAGQSMKGITVVDETSPKGITVGY